jgi:hypothetical protein
MIIRVNKRKVELAKVLNCLKPTLPSNYYLSPIRMHFSKQSFQVYPSTNSRNLQ